MPYALLSSLFLSLLLLLAPGPALAVQGIIAKVNGCESIIVTDDVGKGVNVRLFGVVCPKSDAGQGEPQPFAAETLGFLQQLLPKGQPVAMHDMRRDTMGRERGYTLTLPGGLLVQTALLEAGLAWLSPLHCGACRDWKKLESQARKAGRGVWSDKSFRVY